MVESVPISNDHDILIRGGLVVSGERTQKLDVAIKGEKIAAIETHPSELRASREIDGSGYFVLPGIIDAHNHPINLDKMDTFTLSSAFGGVTTVIPFMQNMRSRGIEGTTSETIESFIEESSEISY